MGRARVILFRSLTIIALTFLAGIATALHRTTAGSLTIIVFPRGYLLPVKSVKGFQTGDMVRAVVPKGKHAGTHIGRVAIRATGSFNLHTSGLVRQGISHKHMHLIQRNDGYKYERMAIPPTTKPVGFLPENV